MVSQNERIVEIANGPLRAKLEACLRRTPGLHLYSIGDLDDAYGPFARFFASLRNDDIAEVVLLYSASTVPTLLVLSASDPIAVATLARAVVEDVGLCEAYVHASPGVREALARDHAFDDRGQHLKMMLATNARLDDVARIDTVTLGRDDLPEIEALYREAYPENFFDPATLDTGFVVGVREESALVAIAGIHTLSRTHRVAALGNIATHPRVRGRKIAQRLTAALSRRLLDVVDLVGLNVADDNRAAIRAYEAIGFETVAQYDESVMTRRPSNR